MSKRKTYWLKNAHQGVVFSTCSPGASVDDLLSQREPIRPGAKGLFDLENPSVKIYLRAGMLEPADKEAAEAVARLSGA